MTHRTSFQNRRRNIEFRLKHLKEAVTKNQFATCEAILESIQKDLGLLKSIVREIKEASEPKAKSK